MSPAEILDQALLRKIGTRKDKSLDYIRQQVSKRARRQNVTSEVALVLWAQELGIGTSSAFRKLKPHMQDQVRQLSAAPAEAEANQATRTSSLGAQTKSPDPVLSAADYLIEDEELLSRVKDLLRRKKHHDRVMREATTVLEDRIRNIGGITDPLRPEELVNTVLNPDRQKAVLLYGSSPSDQQGFHSICRGIVLAIRHNVHHRLTDDVSREDALRFCAFVDLLLAALGTTTPRI
jgi:hypothetical protein